MAGLALLLAVFLASGLRGLDFGRHWDEFKQVEVVVQSIENGRLLPSWYFYPSVTYWLACAPLLPEVVGAWRAEPKPFSRVDYPATSARLVETAEGADYRLRMRALFLLVSSLSLVWLALARGGPASWEGLFAAALVGTSFEVGYHARWVAPDTVLMQFAALFLACSARAGLGPAGRRWWLAAAASAGAATATKYTAGLLLLPLLAPLAMAPSASRDAGTAPGDAPSPWRRLRLALRLILVWAATYLVLTPGTLLEPVKFFQDLKFERLHYLRHGHYGFTVEPGLEHYGLALRYLATSLFSPWVPIAAAVCVLAALGTIRACRKDPRHCLVLALFPLAYFAYFGTTRVLFVRNLLVLAPWLALAAAHGASWVVSLTRGRASRLAAAAAFAALPVLGAVELARAAATMPPVEASGDGPAGDAWQRRRLAAELDAWARAHPDRRLFLSPASARLLEQQALGLPPGATTDRSDDADLWVVASGEGPLWGAWQSNVPGAFEADIGPRDVSFPWYTSWPSPRLLLLTPARAAELGIRLE